MTMTMPMNTRTRTVIIISIYNKKKEKQDLCYGEPIRTGTVVAIMWTSEGRQY